MTTIFSFVSRISIDDLHTPSLSKYGGYDRNKQYGLAGVVSILPLANHFGTPLCCQERDSCVQTLVIDLKCLYIDVLLR